MATPRTSESDSSQRQPDAATLALGLPPRHANVQSGRATDVPNYDFTKHSRTDEPRRVEPADVVIIEGILVLFMEEIR